MKTVLQVLAIVATLVWGQIAFAQSTLIDGKDSTGTRRTVVVDATGQLVAVTSSAVSGPQTAAWTNATPADTVLQISTDGFTTVGIQYIKTGTITTGSILFEVSNNGSTWVSVAAAPTAGTTVSTAYTLTTGTTAFQVFVSGFRYFRIRLSVQITGTGTANLVIMSSQAGAKPSSEAITGTKTPNAAVPDGGNIGTLPAVANAAAPTFTETYQTALSTDLAGNLRTTVNNTVPVLWHPGYLAAGAPTFGGATDNVTTGSTPFCSLTPGSTYRVCCSAAVTWRMGAATPTAVTTDSPLYGPVCEDIALGASDTCIAMITASGTATCSGLLRRTTP